MTKYHSDFFAVLSLKVFLSQFLYKIGRNTFLPLHGDNVHRLPVSIICREREGSVHVHVAHESAELDVTEHGLCAIESAEEIEEPGGVDGPVDVGTTWQRAATVTAQIALHLGVETHGVQALGEDGGSLWGDAVTG